MNPSEAEFDFDVVDFVTSDHHFSHARIIELVGRPFASVEETNTVMIDRWNEFVGPDDVVLHLGDLALGPIESSIALTSRLNGRRLLVPGNHDRVSPATQSNRAIERFRPLYEEAGWTLLPEILRGDRRGVRLLASHYPYSGDSTEVERHSTHRPADGGSPLLHGHTHSRDFGPHGSHEFHVGVDAFGFEPVQFEVIDVWLADLRPEDHESIELEDVARDLGEPSSDGRLRCAYQKTAMDIVRSAEGGEISREELVDILQSWVFERKHRARGLADDWESRPNSFEAVEHAFAIDLIDEDDYRRIFERAGRTDAS